jgi:hypothetical protein
MFCDACGTVLQAGQEFCSKCGKAVKEGLHLAYPRRSRVQEHVRLLAILWMAYSALDLLGSAALFILSETLFGPESHTGPAFLHLLMQCLAVFVFLKAVAGFFVGWGLLQREAWARIFAMVLAFPALLHVPFGTALGVYTLWVLLPTESELEYEMQGKAA